MACDISLVAAIVVPLSTIGPYKGLGLLSLVMAESSKQEVVSSSVVKHEPAADRRRSNQVKVTLNNDELELLDGLVSRMSSDRSSVFRYLLNNSFQQNINDGDEDLNSENDSTYKKNPFVNFPKSVGNFNPAVHLAEPKSFDEIPQNIKYIDDKQILILNLTMMEAHEAQRAVDFVAGATFGLKGNQERIGESIFLFTSSNTIVTTSIHHDESADKDLTKIQAEPKVLPESTSITENNKGSDEVDKSEIQEKDGKNIKRKAKTVRTKAKNS